MPLTFNNWAQHQTLLVEARLHKLSRAEEKEIIFREWRQENFRRNAYARIKIFSIHKAPISTQIAS